MKNRVINLFIQNSSFCLKAIIILVIIFILFSLGGKIQKQRIEVVKLKQELKQTKELGLEIPKLEEKVKSLQAQPKKIKFVLNGIFIQNNVPAALIGENICYENDSIDGFIILKITPNSVILQDKSTQKTQTLFIPE